MINLKPLYELKNLYLLQFLLYTLPSEKKKIYNISRNYQSLTSLIVGEIFMNYMDLNNPNLITFYLAFLWNYIELEACHGIFVAYI